MILTAMYDIRYADNEELKAIINNQYINNIRKREAIFEAEFRELLV